MIAPSKQAIARLRTLTDERLKAYPHLTLIQHQPKGELVIFFRKDGFYPIHLLGLKPCAKEAADHAACNPGTVRIETIAGEVLWVEGAKH